MKPQEQHSCNGHAILRLEECVKLMGHGIVLVKQIYSNSTNELDKWEVKFQFRHNYRQKPDNELREVIQIYGVKDEVCREMGFKDVSDVSSKWFWHGIKSFKELLKVLWDEQLDDVKPGEIDLGFKVVEDVDFARGSLNIT
jgi:hypothetical protein